ncbi:hypothetical protein OOT46_09745 [Aquabacterium sp. A7-Y]|uniref:hypothetical protein n=1 Tax=Aquabacterium sp. A7-Y TaxID=1349605 RepID=UPI00223D16FF|nr:hypothetical protein [Aquabacterium sp. A7-Y]MCW7538130.1 hypothetical protein [Aquabacterium sp. A7-Y]
MLFVNMSLQKGRDESLNTLGKLRDGLPDPIKNDEGRITNEFKPFSDPQDIRRLKAAIEYIEKRILHLGEPAAKDSIASTCNAYFLRLPRRRSLEQLVTDPGEKIWIHYDPIGTDAGAARGKDITLGRKALGGNVQVLAATLIHELAHVVGARDDDGTAEDALLHCGLSKQHVANNIIGKSKADAAAKRQSTKLPAKPPGRPRIAPNAVPRVAPQH